ncbi:siderophore-interacting protein [Sinorhizobium sp. BG8]|uniref:siderophore-interacting protein n=1 Tax=Sinorhizobium sp. BG8 TaxID=2613773 RepID=UPI00193E699F|nr:siderophore-interacting protein [Sinorhizobium sp. BG8]
MDANFLEVTVGSKQLLSPGMIRLSFVGDGLSAFRSTGIGDEYLRLFFPNEETGEVVLPIIDEKGHWSYREGKPPVRCATYTVRRFDEGKRQLDIDFVVHAGGTASEWAQQARPGCRMIINRPRAIFDPPEDRRWQLLLADATGLPAVCRLLEEATAGVQTRVIIEVACPEDEIELPEYTGVSVTWLHGSGNGVGPSRLDEVFRMMSLPETPGYLWVAAEQKAVRAIRKHVRQVMKMPAERYQIVAYWIDQKKN